MDKLLTAKSDVSVVDKVCKLRVVVVVKRFSVHVVIIVCNVHFCRMGTHPSILHQLRDTR